MQIGTETTVGFRGGGGNIQLVVSSWIWAELRVSEHLVPRTAKSRHAQGGVVTSRDHICSG